MSDKSNDICPKCGKLLDKEGFCWPCMTKEYNEAKTVVERIERDGINSWATSVGYQLNIGKMNRVGPKLGYGVYNDMRNKKPNEIRNTHTDSDTK